MFQWKQKQKELPQVIHLKAKKDLLFLVIHVGQLQNRRCVFFKVFFLAKNQTQFPIQSMVAQRGRTNQANIHTPMWRSYLKHSAAEFQFWLQLDIVSEQTKKKTKNDEVHAWDDTRGDQKPETFISWPQYKIS